MVVQKRHTSGFGTLLGTVLYDRNHHAVLPMGCGYTSLLCERHEAHKLFEYFYLSLRRCIFKDQVSGGLRKVLLKFGKKTA
jgi:hypothetical protein